MALRWEAPFDPDEVKDYTRDWTAEMDARSDTLASVSFELPADAVAAGLTVQDAVRDSTNKKAIAWFVSSNPALTLSSLGGTRVPVDHTIVTAGGRTLNETILLRVASK